VWWPTLALTSGVLLAAAVHAMNFPPSTELYLLFIVSAAWFSGLRALRQHVKFFVLFRKTRGVVLSELDSTHLSLSSRGGNSSASGSGGGGSRSSKEEGTGSSSNGQRAPGVQKSYLGAASGVRGASKQLNKARGKIKSMVEGEADKAKRQVARIYAIVYDCVFKREFLRNHVLLALCVTLGYFVNSQFYALMLLDVVNLVPLLSDLIQSIMAQGKPLGLIFYLFCTTVIIFASFGMNNFKDDLSVPSNENDQAVCGSMLSCFYYLFYHGARGNIQAVLSIPDPGSQHYVMRIVFDTVFFVWVGLVLRNIITGLMVEFFSSARINKRRRAHQMDTEVCSMLSSIRFIISSIPYVF
jgi:hypothetical protein